MGINGQSEVCSVVKGRQNNAIRFSSKRKIVTSTFWFQISCCKVAWEHCNLPDYECSTMDHVRGISFLQGCYLAPTYLCVNILFTCSNIVKVYAPCRNLALFLAGSLIKNVGKMTTAAVLSVIHSSHENTSTALVECQPSIATSLKEQAHLPQRWGIPSSGAQSCHHRRLCSI